MTGIVYVADNLAGDSHERPVRSAAAGDDGPALQAAINRIASWGAPGVVEVPSGSRLDVQGPIDIPASLRGLVIRGASFSDGNVGSAIRNTATDGSPLFRTTGASGTCAFVTIENLALGQVATAGSFFQFDHLTVQLTMRRIYASIANPAARFVHMNGVESAMNSFENIQVIAPNVTVSPFDIEGPADSNLSTSHFERITVNSPGASAPQFRVVNAWSTAAPGFSFDRCNLEQPDGGGIHLYGVSGKLSNCISSDTASLSAPVFLIDKGNSLQAHIEVSLDHCHSYVGTEANPDLKVQNTAGGVAGIQVHTRGGRYVWVDAGQFPLQMWGGSVAGYASGMRPPLRAYANALMGVRGIAGDHGATAVDLSRSLSGVATFDTSGTVTVTLNAADPEADTDYEIVLGPCADETIWVDQSSKTTTTFDLKSSNASSTARVAWMLVRP